MTSDPEITIITAAWNAERYIGDTIRSVQAQSLQNWEHIIVDDGSTDGTGAIARDRGDLRQRVLSQANAGQSTAQNFGLEHARAPFVVMLDADDLLRVDALDRLRAAFDESPEIVASFGHIGLIDEAGARIGVQGEFAPDGPRDMVRDLLQRNIIPTGGVAMIRTEVLIAAGGFNPTLKMSQGWECWLRLALRGSMADIGGGAVLDYRLRSGSVARSGARDPKRSYPAIDLMYGQPEIARKFSAVDIRRMRKSCEAALTYSAGQEALRAGAWTEARAYFAACVRLAPAHFRAWTLFACCLVRYLPRPIARRVAMR